MLNQVQHDGIPQMRSAWRFATTALSMTVCGNCVLRGGLLAPMFRMTGFRKCVLRGGLPQMRSAWRFAVSVFCVTVCGNCGLRGGCT